MDSFTKLKHQAAGHDGAMTDESETLFVKPSTNQEIEFYTQVQALGVKEEQDGKDREGDRLVDFMPVFMGTLESGITEKVEESTTEISDEIRKLDLENKAKLDIPKKPLLVLQNMLQGFNKPCIMDIKLGAILHDENTSEEKVKRLQKVSETTTSGSLNYRVCGMKLNHDTIPDNLSKCDDSIKNHISEDDGYLVFNKFYGRALTPITVVENFKIYFHHNNLNKFQQKIILENFYTRIQLLYNCLLSYELRIRSGSLLFVYENDVKRWDEQQNEDPLFREDFFDDEEDDDDDEGEGKDDNEDKVPPPLSTMCLIDFAHAKFTPGEGIDENIIQGIENILEALDELINNE